MKERKTPSVRKAQGASLVGVNKRRRNGETTGGVSDDDGYIRTRRCSNCPIRVQGGRGRPGGYPQPGLLAGCDGTVACLSFVFLRWNPVCCRCLHWLCFLPLFVPFWLSLRVALLGFLALAPRPSLCACPLSVPCPFPLSVSILHHFPSPPVPFLSCYYSPFPWQCAAFNRLAWSLHAFVVLFVSAPFSRTAHAPGTTPACGVGLGRCLVCENPARNRSAS